MPSALRRAVRWLVGPAGSSLLYGKAGGAWSYSSVDATTNGDPGIPTTDTSRIHWGWMLGAGVEHAISQRWSLKAEYDFLSFGNQGLSTPISDFQSVPSPDPNLITPVASTETDYSQDTHLFKVGLNYRLGDGQPTTMR